MPTPSAREVKETSPDPEITIKKSLQTPTATSKETVSASHSTPLVNGKENRGRGRPRKSVGDYKMTVAEAASRKKRMREEYDSEDSKFAVGRSRLNTVNGDRKGPPPSKRQKSSTITNRESSNDHSAPSSKRASKAASSEDETTYVLPANLSEWGKLFEMVKSQMDSGTLSNNRAGAIEAKTLLKNQNKITSLPLEEQVRIFNRLCSLANIQVD